MRIVISDFRTTQLPGGLEVDNLKSLNGDKEIIIRVCVRACVRECELERVWL